jgi:hypothetical protein
MLDDRQRNVRKRLQDPLSHGRVGPLVLVLWVQTGESDLLLLQRPSQDKLRARSHPDTERQQGCEALHGLVELDTQRRERPAALEAVAEAFTRYA